MKTLVNSCISDLDSKRMNFSKKSDAVGSRMEEPMYFGISEKLSG